MKAPMVHLALLVLLVNADPPAQLDPPVSPDALAHKDPQALLERRVDQERKDLKAPLVETVSRDLWVFLDLLDH